MADFMRLWQSTDISIHAPLAGSDLTVALMTLAIAVISIHAPLAGSDGKYILTDFLRQAYIRQYYLI